MARKRASSSLERLFLSIGCSTFTNELADLPADSDVYTFTRHAKRTFDGDGKQQAYSLLNPYKQEALDWLADHISNWSDRAAEDAVLILFLSTHGFEIQGNVCLAWKDASLERSDTLMFVRELQYVVSPWFHERPKRSAILILQSCRSPLNLQPPDISNDPLVGSWWILSAVKEGAEEGWEPRTARDNEDFSASGRLTRRICSSWEKLEQPVSFLEFVEKVGEPYRGEKRNPPPLLVQGAPAQDLKWLPRISPYNPPITFEGKNLFKAFEEEEQLYGREAALRAALGVLYDRDFPSRGWLYEEERTLFYGPSGSGKTSFIRAGIIPWLKKSHRAQVVKELKRQQPEQAPTIHEESAKISAQAAILYVDLSIEDVPSDEALEKVTFLFLDQAEGKSTKTDLKDLVRCIETCDKKKSCVVVLLREDFVGEWGRLWRETPWSFTPRIFTPLTKREAEDVLYATLPADCLTSTERQKLLVEVGFSSSQMVSHYTFGTLSPVLLQMAMIDAWSRKEFAEGSRIRLLATIWKEHWKQTMEEAPAGREALLALLSAFVPLDHKQLVMRRSFTEQELVDWLAARDIKKDTIEESCSFLVKKHWLREVSEKYVLSHDALIPFLARNLEENANERRRRTFLRRIQEALGEADSNPKILEANLRQQFHPLERSRLHREANFWWKWLELENPEQSNDSKEEVLKSKEEVLKSKEEVLKSKEEVLKSKEEVLKVLSNLLKVQRLKFVSFFVFSFLFLGISYYLISGLITSINFAEERRINQEKRFLAGEDIAIEVFRTKISEAVKKGATEGDVRSLLHFITDYPKVLESPIARSLVKALPKIAYKKPKCDILERIVLSIPRKYVDSLKKTRLDCNAIKDRKALYTRDQLFWDGKNREALYKLMKEGVVDRLVDSSSEANSQAIILLARLMERSGKIEDTYIAFRNEMLLRYFNSELRKRFDNSRKSKIPLSNHLIAILHSVGNRSLRPFLNAPENSIFSKKLMDKSVIYLKKHYSEPFSLFSNYAFFWFTEKYHNHSKDFTEWVYKQIINSVPTCNVTENALSHGVLRMQFHLLSNNLKSLDKNDIKKIITQFSFLDEDKCTINEVQFAYQIFISKASMEMIAKLDDSKHSREKESVSNALNRSDQKDASFFFGKLTNSLYRIIKRKDKEKTSYYDIFSTFQRFFVHHVDLLVKSIPKSSSTPSNLCHVLGFEYNNLISNYRKNAINALIKFKEKDRFCDLKQQINALSRYSPEHRLMQLAYKSIPKVIVPNGDSFNICNKEDNWQTIIDKFNEGLEKKEIAKKIISNLVVCLRHHERDVVRYSIRQIRIFLSKIHKDKQLLRDAIENISKSWGIHTELQNQMLSLIEEVYFHIEQKEKFKFFKNQIIKEFKQLYTLKDTNVDHLEKKLNDTLSYRLSKYFSLEAIDNVGLEAVRSITNENKEKYEEFWKEKMKPFFLSTGVFTKKKLHWFFKKICQKTCPKQEQIKVINYLFKKNWTKMFNSKISKVSLSCEEIQCRQEKNAIKRKDPNTDEATEKVIGSLPTHTRKIFYRFYDFQASKKKMTVFLKGIEEDFSFDIRSLIIGRLLMEGGSKKELRQSISEWIKKAKNKDKNKNKKLFEDVLLCLTAVSENSVPPTTLREETCKLAEEHTSRKLYLRKFYER